MERTTGVGRRQPLTVRDVMSSPVVTVTPSTSLREVARTLVERRISAVPVIGADGTPVGVVSEADLVLDDAALLRTGAATVATAALLGAPVAGQVMSSPVAVIEPAAPLAEAGHAMGAQGVRRLLVVDGTGSLVGVVSRADLVRAMLRDDADIRRDVLAEVTDSSLSTAPETVAVSVIDGAVTLSGRVASQGQVAALMAAAAAVDGVVGLTSALTVDPTGAGADRPSRPFPPLGGPHRRVADVMATDLVVATPSTSVADLARLMRQHAVSALPVVDEDDRPVGVVSEADLVVKERELAAHHGGLWTESHATAGDRLKAKALEARELMSSPPVTIGGVASLAAAARLMAERGVKRLLVVDDAGHLRGLVSRRDLLKVYDAGDGELRRRVLEAVAPRACWTDLAAVDVAVDGGVVTLRGSVPYRSDAVALVGIAEAVEGIAGVRDELTSAVDDVGDLADIS